MEDNKPLHKTVQKVETIDHVDGDTGECLGTDIRIQTFQHEVEPPYVKLYTQDIGRLYGLTESTQNVLMALAKHMVYRTNVIVLYGPIKTLLMQELKMNKNTFNKAIDTLEGVIALETPVPLKRYNKRVSHKQGVGPGRYPKKAAAAVLGVIKSAVANAE